MSVDLDPDHVTDWLVCHGVTLGVADGVVPSVAVSHVIDAVRAGHERLDYTW